MDLMDYKPNSHKSKEEQQQQAAEKKKIDKVITNPVKMKKSGIRTVKDVIMSGDTEDVKTYVIWDILVPTVKRAISEIVDMIIWGKGGKQGKRSTADYVSYNKFSDPRYDRRGDNGPGRVRYTYRDITISSRGDAERVLSQMQDIVAEYGMVSIADLYEMVGETGAHTDHNYGWTNLNNVGISRGRDGYTLDLPKAISLKN